MTGHPEVPEKGKCRWSGSIHLVDLRNHLTGKSPNANDGKPVCVHRKYANTVIVGSSGLVIQWVQAAFLKLVSVKV